MKWFYYSLDTGSTINSSWLKQCMHIVTSKHLFMIFWIFLTFIRYYMHDVVCSCNLQLHYVVLHILREHFLLLMITNLADMGTWAYYLGAPTGPQAMSIICPSICPAKESLRRGLSIGPGPGHWCLQLVQIFTHTIVCYPPRKS